MEYEAILDRIVSCLSYIDIIYSCDLVLNKFTHIVQDNFICTEKIPKLSQRQWNKPNGCGQIRHVNSRDKYKIQNKQRETIPIHCIAKNMSLQYLPASNWIYLGNIFLLYPFICSIAKVVLSIVSSIICYIPRDITNWSLVTCNIQL